MYAIEPPLDHMPFWTRSTTTATKPKRSITSASQYLHFFFYDWQKYYIFEAVAREQFALWRNYIGDKIGEIRLSPRDFELFAGCISYSICHEKREREKVQPTENKRTHKLSSGFHRQEMTDRANSSDLEIYWTTDVSNMLRLRGASMQTLRL